MPRATESRREFRPLTRAERNSDRVDADDEEELYEKERERKERPKADGRYSATLRLRPSRGRRGTRSATL